MRVRRSQAEVELAHSSEVDTARTAALSRGGSGQCRFVDHEVFGGLSYLVGGAAQYESLMLPAYADLGDGIWWRGARDCCSCESASMALNALLPITGENVESG
jgi:hypothetical protein